jgi:hypothetical protein
MRRGAGRCHRLFVSRALTASKEGEPAAVKEVGAAFGTSLSLICPSRQISPRAHRACLVLSQKIFRFWRS